MAKHLFDRTPEYADVEDAVNSIVGYSMRELCMADPRNVLHDTRYTQPAMYVVNALYYYDARRRGERPEVLAGHSLGEYNALLAAGAFDLLTGLRLVCKRGEVMSRAHAGGMAAVVGLPASRIAAVLQDQTLSAVDIANYNAPSQTILSGPIEDLTRAMGACVKAGAALCIPVRVSAPFHSRYMAAAAREYETFLQSCRVNPLTVPVVANVTASAYPADASLVRSLLVQQIYKPVRWMQSIDYMRRVGVTEFREVGAGNVLTRLLQQMPKEAA